MRSNSSTEEDLRNSSSAPSRLKLSPGTSASYACPKATKADDTNSIALRSPIYQEFFITVEFCTINRTNSEPELCRQNGTQEREKLVFCWWDVGCAGPLHQPDETLTMTLKKDVKYSILELAAVPAGSEPRDVFKNSLELARKAEEWGYTRFWLAEHHNMISIASVATVVLIAHIAGGTRTIRVGSGGIMLPNHSPLIVAEQFGTLGALFPGRIDLGLGTAPGTDQDTARAIRPDRMMSVYRFPDEVADILQYFSPDNIDARVRAPVAEGVDVPVYILGSSTDSAIVAARMGLPYAFASHFAPAQLFEALEIYYNNFEPSAYLSSPYTIAGANVVI